MANTNRVVFPNGDDLPASNQLVGADGYYSVFLESVCISRDETFWKKNVVGLTANLTVGTAQPVSLPVYSDRAANTDALLALSHSSLVTYVPSKGQSVQIGASMLRFDNQDFIKKALQAVSLAQGSTELTTYAASAVPYVTLAAAVGNQIYNAFGPKNGEVLIKTQPSTLSVDDTNPRFQLRDCYMLHYFGPDNMDDSALYVHAADVYWKATNSRLRSGPWFLFRVERFEKRPDQQSRPWFVLFSRDCLGEFDKLSPDIDKAKKAYSDALVLLENDPDFTGKDKASISRDWRNQLKAKEVDFPTPKSIDFQSPASPLPSPHLATSTSQFQSRGELEPNEAMALLGFDSDKVA